MPMLRRLFSKPFFCCFLCCISVSLSLPIHATSISLNILNNENEGLNDNTATAPLGGNTGITLGQQRQNVIHFAAQLLEQVIDSSIPIIIDAEFDSLSCNASAATLGFGGPSSNHFGNSASNYPFANTYYPQALANSINGFDLNTARSDMKLTFNSDIDNNNNCLDNRNWYYGLDGGASIQDIDFLSVVLHEILHGIGFSTLTNKSTGQRLNNRDDIFMRMLEDHNTGLTWQQMTNTERAASATGDPNLHWIGSNVQANIASLSAGTHQGHVKMHAPSTFNIGSVSHFSQSAEPFELMEPFISQAVNSIGLAKALLQDIGWTTSAGDNPVIADIGNVEIINSSPTSIDFALLDNDTDIAAINLSASSSNTSIIENSGITFIGNQRLRQVTVTPIAGASGTVNITLTASDGSNSNNQTFQVNVVSNLTPSIAIISPATGDTILTNSQSLTVSANDSEDGDISSNTIWSSSIDGALGSGATIVAMLSDGNHNITASITDSSSNTETFTISIIINALSDDDNDGLNNSTEIALGTDPFDSDSDNDYLSDFEEVNADGNASDYNVGVDSDPNNPDTDGDGYKDGLDANPLNEDPPEGNIPLLPLWAMGLLSALLLLATRKKLKHTIRI